MMDSPARDHCAQGINCYSRKNHAGAPPDAAPSLDRATALARHELLVQGLLKGSECAIEEGDRRFERAKESLATLWAEAEAEGDADADDGTALQALEEGLRGSQAARAWFEAHRGYRLAWFFFTDAQCEATAGVLRAAATPALLWPPDAWSRLLAAAVAPGEDITGAAAMRLVVWAAETCPAWVTCQWLVAPLEGGQAASPQPPLAAILGALAAHSLGAGQAHAAAALLELYGADAAAAAALRTAGAAPLAALLSAVSGAETMCAGVPDVEPSLDVGSLPPEEAAALRALREKRKMVYDAAAVDLRRRLLRVLRSLCAHRDLILDEALVRGPGGRVGEGPLVGAALRLLGEFLDSSPNRTAPVLGPDGSTVSYVKRPYAADWKDNPAGDFLATLDLDGAGDANKHAEPVTTQLELLADAVEAICASSKAAATVAHRRGAVGVCRRLNGFLTSSVSGAGRRIAAVLAQNCVPALEEVLSGDSVGLAIGLAVHLPDAQARAFDKLAGVADSCSGDDFAEVTGMEGPLAAALAAATGGGPAAPAGTRLLQLCADRALRHGKAGSAGKLPRGGGWEGLEPKALRGVLSPAQPKTAVTAAVAAADREGLGQFKKGFLLATPRRPQAVALPPTPAPLAPPSPRASHYRGGVVIEEINGE